MIIAYITDARTEYAKTVFEKIGLPVGSRVKLRYSSKWIDPALRTQLNGNTLLAQDVLICYMDGNHGDLSNARAVALRYSRIRKSERIADFVNIECELMGFPSSPELRQIFDSADDRGLLNPGPRSGLFIVNATPLNNEQRAETAPDRWGLIVGELAKCSFFRDASFLYWEKLTSSRNRDIACRGGSYRISAGSIVTARIHSYATSKESRLHQYEMRVDSNAIEAVDGNDISVAFGKELFDLRFLILPSERMHPTRIRLAAGPSENGAFFAIPIEVMNRRFGTAMRRSSVAISGAAAATAGVLPDATPIGIRVALIVVGSIGLGLSARSSG
jgi:hypothetical protein